FFAALQIANPTTVVQWEWQGGDMAAHYEHRDFKIVFWAFGPAIQTFQRCPLVISMDGTHLRGSYKGKLLVAVAQTANKRLLPIAYAIVDEESRESWSFFLTNIRQHVVGDRHICFLSDRDGGLQSAVDSLAAWQEPAAYHRFCLRHLRSNVVTRYMNSKIRNWCWELGSQLSERKFQQIRERLSDFNPDAYNYLFGIPLNKWTLLGDEGGRRWGTLTTNMSESYNNVLKGVRFLPCRALVRATFMKTLDLFEQEQKKSTRCSNAIASAHYAAFCELESMAANHR
ncbi:MuDR family transposase, partial [Striga hermonthica]